MEQIFAAVKWVIENGPDLVGKIVAVLTALLGVAMFFPGPQPQKFLHGAVDFLAKFSRKPKP